MNEPLTWGAIAAALSLAVTAVVFTARASYLIGRMQGTIKNGMEAALKRIEHTVETVGEKVSKLPCGERKAEIASTNQKIEYVERRIEHVEQRSE